MSLCESRTDAETVKALCGVEPAGAFLQSASLIIDSVAACAIAQGATEAELTLAEAWLTCHLMEVSKVGQDAGAAPKKSEKFESYSIEWATSKATGAGIMATHYGATANNMTHGCLVEKDKRNAIIFFAGAVGQASV